MTRYALIIPAALAALAAAAAAATPKSDYEYFRQRLDQVNREIAASCGKIKQEITDSLGKDIKHKVKQKQKDADGNEVEVEVEVGDIDMDEIDKVLAGRITPEKIKSLLGQIKTPVDGTLAFVQEQRDKLAEYRRPLDALDAQIKLKQDEYDQLMNSGYEIDLWGLVEPVGTYGDRMRELYRELSQLRKDRAALKDKIDQQIQADLGKSVEGIEKFQANVTRAYQEFYASQLPGGAAVKSLAAELALLVAERDRLEEQLKSGSMYVGWVHVGTAERFDREKYRPRGSEIWGGRGGEPLKNTQLLDAKGYATMEGAVKAVGAAFGKATRKTAPLAQPRVYYGFGPTDENKIGFEIVNHPAFKEFLPAEQP